MELPNGSHKKFNITENIIIIETYYKEKIIDAKFYSENTDLFNDYPTREEVENFRRELEKTIKPGEKYAIIISEQGVIIEKR